MNKTRILIFFASTLFLLNTWLLFKTKTGNSTITKLVSNLAKLEQVISTKEDLLNMFENDIQLMLFFGKFSY
jgi:hypothetical protein